MSSGHFDTSFVNLRLVVSELRHIYEILAPRNFDWHVQLQNDVTIQKNFGPSKFRLTRATSKWRHNPKKFWPNLFFPKSHSIAPREFLISEMVKKIKILLFKFTCNYRAWLLLQHLLLSLCIAYHIVFHFMPCVIFKGSLISPTKVVVCIEKEPVCKMDSVLRGIVYAFCIYYVFNMEYNSKIIALLEFVQR